MQLSCLETEKQNVISKLKFKIVFWHIFLSPIELSEKKRPLVIAVVNLFSNEGPFRGKKTALVMFTVHSAEIPVVIWGKIDH